MNIEKPPTRPRPASLRFEQLIIKVEQAEDALEASERTVAADVRQLRSAWRAAWTPGRIVIAGLAAGFIVGRADPMRALGKSGGLMQLVSMLSSLFAGGSAKVAAEEASEAAANTGAAAAASTAPPSAEEDEAATLARAEATLQAARVAAVDPVEP